ncbi:thioredoxin domain-containing protein [Alkalihalobacillus sp. 1P02AB]|uniref:thioredoxin domain-containing protein n=1 Tax=Alkalihalobacillus sp. 1P02AB TaxID=3132260 RepID=UPI0039A68B8B
MSTSSTRTSKFIVIFTLALVVTAVLFFFFSQKDEPNQDIIFSEHPDINGQPILGNQDALVSVVEFGDYKCPACKRWDETILPQLQEDFIDDGLVHYSYINTLFHGEESGLAALASESVWHHHPEAFWEYHQEIFHQQPASQNHDEAWVTPLKLVEIAAEIEAEIDLEQLAADIIEQTFIDELTADTEQVIEYDIQLTPSIVINGTLVEDPFDYEHIKSLIEKELED